MAAIESAVQLAPDSTGKLIRTEEVLTSKGTVEVQVVAIGDPANGGLLAYVSPNGELYVRAEEATRVSALALEELRLIRYAMGKLIGEYLKPGHEGEGI